MTSRIESSSPGIKRMAGATAYAQRVSPTLRSEMPTAEELTTLREGFEEIGAKAEEHFASSLEAIDQIAQQHFAQKEHTPRMVELWRVMAENNWNRYAPEELVRAGEALRSTYFGHLLRAGGHLRAGTYAGYSLGTSGLEKR